MDTDSGVRRSALNVVADILRKDGVPLSVLAEAITQKIFAALTHADGGVRADSLQLLSVVLEVDKSRSEFFSCMECHYERSCKLLRLVASVSQHLQNYSVLRQFLEHFMWEGRHLIHDDDALECFSELFPVLQSLFKEQVHSASALMKSEELVAKATTIVCCIKLLTLYLQKRLNKRVVKGLRQMLLVDLPVHLETILEAKLPRHRDFVLQVAWTLAAAAGHSDEAAQRLFSAVRIGLQQSASVVEADSWLAIVEYVLVEPSAPVLQNASSLAVCVLSVLLKSVESADSNSSSALTRCLSVFTLLSTASWRNNKEAAELIASIPRIIFVARRNPCKDIARISVIVSLTLLRDVLSTRDPILLEIPSLGALVRQVCAALFGVPATGPSDPVVAGFCDNDDSEISVGLRTIVVSVFYYVLQYDSMHLSTIETACSVSYAGGCVSRSLGPLLSVP